MADYAIGDIQGCYTPLRRLLDKINFDASEDCLWFVGDLVNRGPESLSVLRFIKSLPAKTRITLGNHDLHLLHALYRKDSPKNRDDTLHEILTAPDKNDLGEWLRRQPILIYEPTLNIVMCHAGIAPCWTFEQACQYASFLESILSGETFHHFLSQMYGNLPNHLENTSNAMERARVICNYFTRMRFCNVDASLNFSCKGTLADARKDIIPWFAVPNRYDIKADIVFGHWAALQGKCPHPRIHAIDTGCYWSGQLTALRLQDKVRFSVDGHQG